MRNIIVSLQLTYLTFRSAEPSKTVLEDRDREIPLEAKVSLGPVQDHCKYSILLFLLVNLNIEIYTFINTYSEVFFSKASIHLLEVYYQSTTGDCSANILWTITTGGVPQTRFY